MVFSIFSGKLRLYSFLDLFVTPAKPFLKWVGGKRQLLPALLPHFEALGWTTASQKALPGRFFEPFIGGGAVFFALSQHPGLQATLNDYNPELVNLYRQVQENPQALAEALAETPFANTAEAHRAIRGWDREEQWNHRTPLERAARFVYLNRTSFNGLWRVNSKGHFNVPFGKYKSPGFPPLEVLAAASEALQRATILNGDFEAAIAEARAGDLVYFDPPYIPASVSANFVGYTQHGFDGGMQDRLASACDRLTAMGVSWVLSNADVPLSHALFGRQDGAVVHQVQANRSINSKGDGRGPVGEIIAVCPGHR